MQRFLNFLTNSRTLSVLGVIVLTIFLLLIAQTFEIGLVWAGIALGVLLALWLVAYIWKRWRARQASKKLEGVLEQAATADKAATPDKREEVEALRVRLAEAVKTIKRSKLGQLSGDAALYELPWYIVIGNPAAGKSTAVVKSGLKFPFADGTGNISYDPQNHDKMVRLRAAKVDGIAREVPHVELDDPSGDADVLVLGWGSTYGPIGAACQLVRAEGLNVAQAHIRLVHPFPSDLGDVVKRYKRVIIPEMNLGQLALLVRAKYLVDAISLTKVQGQPFKSAEIADTIKDVIAHV